jgi:hypothetical protein
MDRFRDGRTEEGLEKKNNQHRYRACAGYQRMMKI